MINLAKYNRHWEKEFRYFYPKKRRIFKELISCLTKKQIIEIIGLRRVGKTVLMFQLINHLLDKRTDPFNILYFTFDEERPSLEEIFQNYSLQTKKNWKKEKIFVFLDEIQKLKNFQNQIKVYYDLYPNLKFFISGSTSLFIKKKTQESLAGRIISFNISPLFFDEYLIFTEKEEMLEKPNLYSADLEKEFFSYLKSQFIETITMKEEEKKDYFRSILKKIIFEDLTAVFKFDYPEILYQIVKFIAQNPGGEVNNVHLSQELKISNKTLSWYFFYLENSFLVKKLYNFSRNLFTSEKKLKKYYLSCCSFSWSLVDFVDWGKIFENYLISLNPWRYFYRDSYKHEVDFVIVREDKKIIPVEAKFKKEVKKQEIKDILLFMKKYQINEGVFFYKGEEKKEKIEGKIIHFLPYFYINTNYSNQSLIVNYLISNS